MSDLDDLVIMHAAEIVTAHVANNEVPAGDVSELIRSAHAALASLGTPAPKAAEEHVPAVLVRRSLARPDVILSMIDGKPYKTLKRHLSSRGLTPDQYRERYNLRPDYPMVAPAYRAATGGRDRSRFGEPGKGQEPLSRGGGERRANRQADAQEAVSRLWEGAHVPRRLSRSRNARTCPRSPLEAFDQAQVGAADGSNASHPLSAQP